MSWDTDLVLMTRVLINDLNAPQKFTDDYLKRVLVCAGVLVNQDIELSTEYSFDITNLTITPDPVAAGDATLQALLPLKSACITNQGQYIGAIGQAIKVRDGDSAIDTSVGFKGFQDILKLGACASYDKLKWQIQASAGSAGGVVLGPYRPPGGRNFIESVSYLYDDFAGFVNRRRGFVGGYGGY